MTRPRKLLLALGSAHALNHAYLLALPPILGPLMEEFRTGPLGGGAALTGLYLASGLGAIPAGWLADRWGPRFLITVFLGGSASCLVLTALASTLAGLAGSVLLLGAFCSLYHPAGLSIVSRECSPIGKALGIHGVGGNLGLALGPALVAQSASLLGWRGAVALLAAPGLLLLPAFAVPRGRVPPGVPGNPRPAPAASRIGFLPAAASIALAGFCYRGVLTFLPLHLSSHPVGPLAGVDPVRAGGILTTLCLVIGVAGQYLGGWLGHTYRAERVFFGLLLCAIPFPFLMGVLRGSPLVSASALFAFLFFAAQPVGNLLIARHSPESRRSMGFGVSFSLSFGVGSLAALTGGWIAETASLPSVFPAMGLPLAGAAVVSVLLAKKSPPGAGSEGRGSPDPGAKPHLPPPAA